MVKFQRIINFVDIVNKYEMGHINEDTVREENTGKLVDMHPYFKGGEYYLYISIYDDSLPKTSNVTEMMMDDIEKYLPTNLAIKIENNPNIIPQLIKRNFRQLKKELALEYLKDDGVNNNDQMYDEKLKECEAKANDLINGITKKYGMKPHKSKDGGDERDYYVMVEDPASLYDKDGKIVKNETFYSIRKFMTWIASNMNWSKQFFQEEFVRAIKMMHNCGKRESKTEDEKQEIIDGVDETTKAMFFQLCQELGEKRVISIFNNISINEDYIVDHVFSPKNIISAIAQSMKYSNKVQDISYLATERQWRKMGRVITSRGYDHPYYLTVVEAGRTNKEQSIELLKSQGKTFLGDKQSFQQSKKANIDTNVQLNKGNKKINFDKHHIFYDVADTEVAAGAYDAWTNDVGSKDNLFSGEANDVTKELIKAQHPELAQKLNHLNGEGDDNQKQYNHNLISLTYEAIYEVYKKNTSSKAAKDRGQIIDFLGRNESIEVQMAQSAKLLNQILDAELSKRYIKSDTRVPLLLPGVIILMNVLKIPVEKSGLNDSNLNISEEMSSALYNPIMKISNSISRKRYELKQEQNSQKKQQSDIGMVGESMDNINNKYNNSELNEMFNTFSDIILFEETYNNIIRKINENAQN